VAGESILKQKVIDMKKKHYPDIYHWKISDRWQSGKLDFLFIRNNKYLWIELKSKDGKVSDMQKYEMKQLKKQKCHYAVCDEVIDVKNLVERILYGNNQQQEA